AETDFLRIAKPEEIKICDPACGSGHMLTYAFDLLYAIYEEEGVDPAEIPEKILTHNLYGIEIDERAGELAAFALTMKARAKQRRFFNKGVKPNICVLENVHFDEGELKNYMNFVGRDLFTAPLQTTLRQFEEADNFGSLIRPDVTDVDGMLRILESKNVSGQLFISMTHQKVLQALQQADYLSPKYHVVIANPPYMGRSNMNPTLSNWLRSNFEAFSSDLFSASVKRFSELLVSSGCVGFMTPNVWMSISTHEALRLLLTERYSISNLVELPLSGFKGATVQICAFTLESGRRDLVGNYIRLVDFKGGDEEMAFFTRQAAEDRSVGWRFEAKSSQFAKISGSPISYFVTERMMDAFSGADLFEEHATPRQGLGTTNNGRFVRSWAEVSFGKVGFGCANKFQALASEKKWFPYSKGGGFRRWFGNDFDVVNWERDGAEIRANLIGKNPNIPRSESHYFKEGITWGLITSANFSARLSPQGGIFDVGGSKAFPQAEDRPYFLGYLNSSLSSKLLKVLNPTLNFQVGDLKRLPIKGISETRRPVTSTVNQLVILSKTDWDSYETSWDFTCLPLLSLDYRQPTLKATYQKLRAHWREMTLEMQRLEEENNRIFIEAYGLQDELKPEVPLNEITLTCNPHYRYGNDKSDEELEALLLADTIRELVSYAVGCMFGRYALNKPGLILANQGETIEDYLKRIPEPSFPADEDNVIPMLDGDWFTDDIAERFRKFLRVAFG
ncbi:BREX-1 system adenine-specific DNA-methyltransferase PglX, partial [Sulfuriflexus sp.]|uniref:BREX-1 system adenine-specific DNA-methyltransferase PglX n=1 Tax=Sulfuriflexus sp. TaxID=2015443 RepID=UPI0028CE04F8